MTIAVSVLVKLPVTELPERQVNTGVGYFDVVTYLLLILVLGTLTS